MRRIAEGYDSSKQNEMHMSIARGSAIRAIGAALLGAPVLADVKSADASDAPPTRDIAKAIVANARKIVNPGGIERLGTVRIGGIEQWTSIRGRNVDNPVLLYVHGGPGYVSMPMSWWWHGWEEYFTVVHWDQRGAGKTYLLNDPSKVAPTLTLERMVTDTEEMIQHLRDEFGQKKIFVLAHSFGTYMGLKVAIRHPDWLHAYIGVGQMANMPESERRGWSYTINAARAARNATAVRELEALTPYYAPGHPPTLEQIFAQRKWLDFYGGVMAFRHGNSAETDLGKISPDYTDADLAHIWDGNEFTEKYLLRDGLAADFSNVRKLDCPLLIFAGRHDVNANSYVAAEWFARVNAPSKNFVWFENSAHLPMTEEPGKFTTALVQSALPFAR